MIFFSDGVEAHSTLSQTLPDDFEEYWHEADQKKVVYGDMFINDANFEIGVPLTSLIELDLDIYKNITVQNSKLLSITGTSTSTINIFGPDGGLTAKDNARIKFSSLPGTIDELKFEEVRTFALAESGGELEFPATTEFSNGAKLILADGKLTLGNDEEVRIKSGGILEIYDTPSFYFGNSDSKIIIEAGGKLVIKSANATNGWLAGNISISGDNWEVNGEIIVEEGASLTMDDFESPNNDVVLPNSTTQITVAGSFNATSSNFTSVSSNDTWWGFNVAPTGSMILHDCLVERALIGVYANGLTTNSVEITNSTISDCSFGTFTQNNASNTFFIASSTTVDNCIYGVFVNVSGNTDISNSTISNSTFDGLYVNNFAFAKARGTTFEGNDIGVKIYGGYADIGRTEFGNNVLYDNTTYDVYNKEISGSGPVILAYGNSWTNGTQNCNDPLGNICYEYGGTPISGCWEVVTTPTAGCDALPKIVSAPADLQAFMNALQEESDEDYLQAESQFLNHLTNFPTSVYKPHAIAGLLRTKKALSKSNEIIPFLNNIISVGSGDDVLVAKEFAVMQHTLESDFSSATLKMNDILNAYTGTPKEIFALVEADYLTNIQSQQGSLTKANFGANQKLKAKFTDSPESLASEILSKIKTQEEVAMEYANSLPTDFELLQNYPNPFNPKTQIEFALKKNLNVSLKIFNTLGQEVKTLVNEIKPTGVHRIEWNGTDSNGSQVASGVYFYKLEVGLQSQTKKMLFLK